ncbi:hypothetical protein QBC34DRAFT_420068 [Podospora aff. communis PSN243]|uniref:Uncharacterized protein n=1 Tax=Podospora aff. communis PSN243 TaxID=3040156 RepID=A0AAV9H3S1_9PEZI|nr:hypothetical protein QBC34DRAFT_420068 [Podospora aff. communis PSN243]
MHLPTTLTTALALALAPTGALGWAKDGNGKWVANDHIYDKVANGMSALHDMLRPRSVHEACTYRNTNNLVPINDVCGYWTNNRGGQFWGRCYWYFSGAGTISAIRCR